MPTPRHALVLVDRNERTLSAEELARDVQGLAADDNDLLALKQLLGDNAGQTTQQMALAVDDDLTKQETS